MRYFSAVAETLNYRAASARLHLSAPALSKQVRDLEEELGVRLLDRDTTHVRLTNAGEVFLADAAQIIAHAERAVAHARDASKGNRGRLVIGNIGPLTAGYMAEAVAAFGARFPDIEVELTDIELPGQIPALEEQAIHVGMIPARDVAGLPAGFRHASVLTTPLAAALSVEHPLAAGRTVTFAQLAREKVLCFRSEVAASSHRLYVGELFAARGLKLPRIAEVRGYESLLAMVAGGQGVSILAGRGSLLRVNGVVLRPFQDAAADTELDLHAVWRATPDGIAAENFVTEFRRLSGAGRRRGATSAKNRRPRRA